MWNVGYIAHAQYTHTTYIKVLHFSAAGSEVEVNDQQIQTEIIETEHKHVQAGSTAKQQGFTQLRAEYTLKKGVARWIVLV